MIGDYICIYNIELHIPNNNISMKTIQQKFTLIDKQKVDGDPKLMIASVCYHLRISNMQFLQIAEE